MSQRSVYRNISPLDHRYYQSNPVLFEKLSGILSEEAAVSYCVQTEVALLKCYIEQQQFGENARERKRLVGMADDLKNSITPEEVYAEEGRTNHFIRAVVNVLYKKGQERGMPEWLLAWIHTGATSADILDTMNSMRMRDVTRTVVLPILIELERELIDLAEEEAETPQIGRTHGQHAVPITFGFSIAEYVSRLGQSILELDRLAQNLRGKLAGAVGCYHATGMVTADPVEMERAYLEELGLAAAEYSSQVVPPEYVLRLLLEYATAFGIIANLADDLRHLQRSEIDEIQEAFGDSQVGSSTMPHKRNPWNCEHVKGMWKAFAPRVMSLYMDQISEHQRDLTNSASSRFHGEIIAGFASAAARMQKIVSEVWVNRDSLARNLAHSGDYILAEPTYILLAMSGVGGAHELVRKILAKCEREDCSIKEVLKSDHPELWARVGVQLRKTINVDADLFYDEPAMYRGRCSECVETICKRYRAVTDALIADIKKQGPAVPQQVNGSGGGAGGGKGAVAQAKKKTAPRAAGRRPITRPATRPATRPITGQNKQAGKPAGSGTSTAS